MTVIVQPSKKNSKRVDLKFPYDGELVAAVRNLPGARWDADSKAWSVEEIHKDAINAFLRMANVRLIAREEAERALNAIRRPDNRGRRY